MAGIETALLANDACGAPIPWLMCCPWLYFDGKLFHHTLARATIAKNLLELCSGHIDRVVKVERMRKAILEGITPMFARPPLPVAPGALPESSYSFNETYFLIEFTATLAERESVGEIVAELAEHLFDFRRIINFVQCFSPSLPVSLASYDLS